MRTRTRTLGATAVTAGLVLFLGLGGNSVAGDTVTSTATPTRQQYDMGSMMSGDMDEMVDMMGSADMSAMHSMMHRMMKGTVDDDVLAACDTAHAAMSDPTVTMPAQGGSQHDAHHGRTRS